MAAADFHTTLEKIKARGYWRVKFYPNTPITTVISSPASAKDIVRNASVALRGWDYPHVPTEDFDYQAMYSASNKAEAWTDWENYKEIWRLYQSGQFVHYAGLTTDWYDEDGLIPDNSQLKKIRAGSILDIIDTIYTLTEVFVFLNNLTTDGLYDDGVNVEISLVNTKDRELQILEPRRASLLREYRSRNQDIDLEKQIFSKEQVLENYAELAFDEIISIFHQFNWDEPPIDTLRADQRKFLERNI